MHEYHVAGLMSGTSLDGVDIALCRLMEKDGGWSYKIEYAETIPYPEEWKSRLQYLPKGSAMELAQWHAAYGHYLGILVRSFLETNHLNAEIIASHGHTIFHQPQNGFTYQIGDGAAIAAECSLPVVADFRTMDVAMGGQGAPLVPLGDQLLFPEYGACLNIGGFANISFQSNGRRLAFDICPANIILNYLSEKLGYSYDKDGLIAASGKINSHLLQKLNRIEFYMLSPPKSLGREWVETILIPIIEDTTFPINDMLCTISEHIAIQLAKILNVISEKEVLVTGGGAFNTFLLNRVAANSKTSLKIPDPLLINYKEALVFALLGVLRYTGEINCLADVTGARMNVSGGGIFLPPSSINK
jgi:anhydro-N-acetylmuramic acid kinase